MKPIHFLDAGTVPVPRRRRLLLALAAAPFVAGLSFVPRAARAAQQAVIEGRDRWLFPAWESYVDDDTPACLKVVDLIGAAVGKLTAHGIHCTIVVAPLKARAAADKLPEGAALSPSVAQRYAAILAHGKQAGLDFVDAVSALANVDTSQDSTYIRADYHWSGHTAEAVADATADRLSAAGPLRGELSDPPALGDWTESMDFGDLATLLPPERRRVIGKDRFIVRDEPDGGGLLADAVPVVQVVGNSMVQPYLGFPQRLAHTLARPVGLTWTFGDTGPWKTLLNYLESPAFAKQKPQALVWQFNEGQMAFGPNASGQWDAPSIMAESAWLDRVEKALAQ
ncbi:alginate O-acetyltransferase AlgX-related protein [Trinickia dinghuensis]|uniref:Twin-arginine translocation pathway signal n=1 Tax=Trinickia dinghuensis TaxID=2291023 RepID=A0A3D8K0J6_9BURK|nr:twin-arginine translocation pathway signal [Trinickia dinghuensis]RDU98414.1 twin-arginine translocation pathway signal [Trinickia dinghuensis]